MLAHPNVSTGGFYLGQHVDAVDVAPTAPFISYQPEIALLDHPELAAGNNISERELRPTATYRNVTGRFRSNCGADLIAAVRSVVGTAARHGSDAYQAIRDTPRGQSALEPG